MKKLVLGALALTCAASVFAQGTVIFNNRITGTLITHIYLGGNSQARGNGANDTVPGNQDWTGYVMLTGSGYSAQLLAAPGSGAAESSLVAALPITTFRTGGAAGNITGATATLGNVLPDANVATLEMVVWDNKGGTITTWDQAKALWLGGTLAAGTSGTFDVAAIGGAINGAPALLNLKSFNIFVIPEPSTMALAGLGAAAMMIFRRRK